MSKKLTLSWFVFLAIAPGPAQAENGSPSRRSSHSPIGCADGLVVVNTIIENDPAAVESDTGRLVHAAISSIIETNKTLFSELLNSQDPRVTYGFVLQSILKDRARLVGLVKDLISRLRPGSPYAVLLNKTLAQMSQTIDCPAKPQDFRRSIAEVRVVRTADDEWDTAELANERITINRHSADLQKYLFEEWGINRSFLAEALAALEIKGLYGYGLRVLDIIPARARKLAEKVFARRSQSGLLKMEIDLIAYNPQLDSYVWIEVKNPSQQVASYRSAAVKSCFDKERRFETFLSIVKSEPDLQHLINTSIKLEFVFRGAGIAPAFADEVLRSYGLLFHNYSVEALNKQLTAGSD